MKYNFNRDETSIVDRILKINKVTADMIDVSNFYVDYDNENIVNFKKLILENKDKRFLIVGDYDCDGICATTIIKRLLDDLGIANNYYIPSRSKEGYGINDKIVNTAIDNNFNVILTVDNGVTANEYLIKAKENGITTLVIDHHEYSEKPNCDGFLHPNLFGSKYDDMCAGGLACLLSSSFRFDDLTFVLGGLATLADMVKVLNYNRYLLLKMLEILKKGSIYQINYLLGRNEISFESLSYHVIPKINAVSRLDEMLNVNMLVKYLLDDENYCLNYVVGINNLNDVRRDLTKKMFETAFTKYNDNDEFVLIYDESFKEGICGLVANKIMHETNKPTIILSIKDNTLIGSGRSPIGFNLYEYLLDFEENFITFGGHANAVGLSIELCKLEKFKEYINNKPVIIDETSKEVLSVSIEELNMSLMSNLETLSPFGAGFEKPLFVLENAIYAKKIIIANKYPKFILNDIVEAISFNVKHHNVSFAKMYGYLQRDTYHQNKLTFNIEDLE